MLQCQEEGLNCQQSLIGPSSGTGGMSGLSETGSCRENMHIPTCRYAHAHRCCMRCHRFQSISWRTLERMRSNLHFMAQTTKRMVQQMVDELRRDKD
jgi:hypothetical protein